MSEPRVTHYTDGSDMAILREDGWSLWRNIARPGEPDDWCDWCVSVPDTGQDGPTALAELWRRRDVR